jgi:flagellar hook-basal body complex protein FliE
MSGIDSIGAAIASASQVTGTQVKTPSAPFGNVLRDMVAGTDALDKQAQTAVTGMLNGQGVEVHDAMIATQKADMAFELALQVRNKAVGAYQQMMAMQF